MPIFKTALHLVLRYRLFFFIYTLGLLGMIVGVTAATYANLGQTGEFTSDRPAVAVVDRDHTELSEALAAFVHGHTTPVDIEDTAEAIELAVAQDRAVYVLIIPAGYQAGVTSAAGGPSYPELDYAISVDQAQAALVDQVVNAYAGAVRTGLVAAPGADLSDILAQADATAGLAAPGEVVQIGQDRPPSEVFTYYLSACVYPMTAGILALVCLVFGQFRSGEVARRNLVAPVPSRSLNLQVTLGCGAIAVGTWLLILVVGCLPFIGGAQVLAGSPGLYGLMALSTLSYSTVPLALGALFGQFALRSGAINGLANVFGLSFYMIGLNGLILGPAMQIVAQCLPSYWYAKALDTLRLLPELRLDALGPYAAYAAIPLLYTAAIGAIALVVARTRDQTAEAGGNSDVATVDMM